MVKALQIPRRGSTKRLRKLIHGETGCVSSARAALHKVQIKRRVFSVWKQRIPDLVAPGEENVRHGRIGLQLFVGGITRGQVKVRSRKAVKCFFARQHTQPPRQLRQQICLLQERLVIFRVCDNVQPVMLRKIIRLVVDDFHIVPQRFQIGLQGISLQ